MKNLCNIIKPAKHYPPTINYFAMWYLTYKSEDMPIPYVKQNIANKLVQLAQYNNREFKKLLREEADMSIVMED